MRNIATIQAYIHKAEVELRQHILPFWMRYAVDVERGGFYGNVSNTLEVDRDADKSALLCARILWTYSAAYRRYRNPEYLDMAHLAYHDLIDRFWDTTYSGLYWMVDADGNPVNTRKHIFGQAFGIYALSEYVLASGAQDALFKTIALFRAIEDYSYDREHQGYFEAYTRDWQLEDDLRLSDKDMNEKKSLNTHLHIMEAYTNFMRVWDSVELRKQLAGVIDLMIGRIIDPKTYHARPFFDEYWNVRSEDICFGHDIETSWLLVEAAEVIGDRRRIEDAKTLAIHMAQATYEQGIDADGGLFYTANSTGILISDKEWWPQAEAVVGFLNAYQLSSRPMFLDAALRSWDFIEQHLIDRVHGEWFKSVTRTGEVYVDEPKVSLWKCPYHNGRMCIEMISRLLAVMRMSDSFEIGAPPHWARQQKDAAGV